MAGSFNHFLSDLEDNGDDDDVRYLSYQKCGFKVVPWGVIANDFDDFANGDITDFDVIPGYIVRSAKKEKVSL